MKEFTGSFLRSARLCIGVLACAFAVMATLGVSHAYASDMYRMYNPETSEHLYTASTHERNELYKIGWEYEGIGWVAPSSGASVYRLYNPGLGDHHYTTNAGERDALVRYHGWNYEGVGWYSGGSYPLYRQYNPGLRTGQHNYTASKGENDILCAYHGWRAEGIGWYGVGGGRADQMPSDVQRPSSQYVWVTKTGGSYHRQTCPTIQNSTNLTRMTVSQARSAGKSACKVCKP